MGFDIDILFGEDHDEKNINHSSRSRTPDPPEQDPVMSPSFNFNTPDHRHHHNLPTKQNMSIKTASQDLIPSIERSQTSISTASSSRNQEKDTKEPSYSVSHHSRESTQPDSQVETPIERPCRAMEEDTSYDDSSTSGSVLPNITPSAHAQNRKPIGSIFGGSTVNGEKTSVEDSKSKDTFSQPRKLSQVFSSARNRPVIILDDDDDDIKVINAISASQEARNKWASARKRKAISVGIHENVVIKKEKKDNSVEPSSRDVLQISPAPPSTQTSGRSSFEKSSDPSTRQNSESSRQSTQNFGPSVVGNHVPGSQSSVTAQTSAAPARKPQNLAAIIAAQQAMMNKGRPLTVPLPKVQAGRPLSSQFEAENSSTAARPPTFVSNLTFPKIQQKASSSKGNSQEGPSQAQVAESQPKEDHSWMNEKDEGESDYDRWKKLQKLLEKKKRSNTINEEEETILFKIRKDIEHKERLYTAAKRATSPEADEEDSLFLPDRPNPSGPTRPLPSRGLVDVEEDGESEAGNINGVGLYRMMKDEFAGRKEGPEDLGLTKSGKPRKSRMKRAATAREVFEQDEMRREKERSKVQKKKSREAVPATNLPTKSRGQSKGTSKKPSKAKGKTKSKERAKGKGKGKGREGNGKKKDFIIDGESLMNPGPSSYFNKGNDDIGRLILDSLLYNDPIADRLHPVFENAQPEPEIRGRISKENQFQTLFANIPQNEYATSSSATDKKRLREASRSFGFAKCKAQDGKWLIKGMKSTLYHHQLLGAQWMVQRELSSQPPHGGLLADSMGLGKTVQTLACMVGNPPGPDDLARNIKATLIVVPAAVLAQWREEIDNHCETKTFPKIMPYKSRYPIPRAVLETLDIVLTTYHEVMKEFPFPDEEGRREIAQTGYKSWWKKAVKGLGILHQVSWYRVVLDEAQAIKNNNARTSLACQNLKSIYRWCLTGTPLLNRLDELFPYLRFLKANYSMDWQTFQRYFCDPNADESYSRIKTLLSYTMMRRTLRNTILNRPIIMLPPAHSELLNVSFSREEQVIYRVTENRFRSNLNAYFAKGGVERSYGFFMVQLLRLRQCTSHPFMLERTIRESWTLEDIEELKSKLARLNVNHAPFYEQCGLWAEENIRKRSPLQEENDMDEYHETADELMPFGQADYGHRFSIDKALKSISKKDLFDRVICLICSDLPVEPIKTDCGHIFCNECFNTHIAYRLAVSDEVDVILCPSCDRVINGTKPMLASQLPQEIYNPFSRGDDDSDVSSGSKARGRIHPSSKGRDALGFEPYTEETWLTRSDVDVNFPFTPSAKTTALKALLLKGFKDAPVDKVVIYVQFRTLARIVGRICNSENWRFLYLTGDSSLEHRTKVIKVFRDDDNIKILVAGLKCGGVGLNFPWANRCISLDLWWNHAVEQQAFGRIFRIGQVKETYLTRVVIKNSVDQRMLTMQAYKLKSLERAIPDGPEPEKPTLSFKQLTNLFGFLQTDKNGKIVSVQADYVDENGNREFNSDHGGPSSGSSFSSARDIDRNPDIDEDGEEEDEGDSAEEELLNQYGRSMGFGSFNRSGSSRDGD